MIPQETIEQIRQVTDIAQVIGEFIRLKRKGKNYEALCPFHTEKTPSFKISSVKQIYHCFGCGKGGNVFTFLMEHEKMSFIEAVRYLARRANIIIRETGTDVKREQLEKLNYAHQVALDYFHNLLFQNRYQQVLENYLKQKRGIQLDNIEFFRLGLSGEEWDGFIKYAAKKDLTTDALLKAGLAVYNEDKKSYYDRFRHRLMFPIFNLSQKPIAFGGRKLKKTDTAKYVNSPETPLYSKSNLLYGLNFARDHIRETNKVFVVEGYFDFISLWQAGIKNVVASSGTAFTIQQARLLARFAEEVFLFFDADSAGQNAALRSVDSLYDAGLEVKVVMPPPGEDPDSVAQKYGRDKIEELQTDALGFIPFRVKSIDLPKAGIIAREKLVKEMKALGDKIADPTRRSLFYDEAAQALAVDIRLFQSPTGGTLSARTSATGNRDQLNRIEFDFLSLLVSNPGTIDEIFQQISPDDFDSKKLSRLYAAMITQYKDKGQVIANKLIENFADEESISLLTEIASVDWEPATVEVEARKFTQQLLKRKQKKIRARLQKELAQAEADGDHDRANRILEELKSYGL
ncbi:MAG: DNA primase [candidate division Zixibacteria bacterium]|nr:DNA primase [candidate division Zixibacteria bacterium]